MSVAPNRRSSMSLYTGSDLDSHSVRMVLAEKEITYDLLNVEKGVQYKEELCQLNPYGNPPLLLDRELVLYRATIIMEYLDERFPHPPLMPVYPIARARTRLMLYRLERDFFSLFYQIIHAVDSEAPEIRKIKQNLQEGITSIAPLFTEMPYFLSEEFSLLDCSFAPLLWRLPMLEIKLPLQAKPVLNYAEQIFKRSAFVDSLTEAEKSMKQS